MNWQGGSLARSRNAKSSLSAIQRKHFAKVRGGLGKPHNSPPSVQVFEFGEWKPTATPEHRSCGKAYSQRRQRSRSQRTLDEFENTGPVVRQLESLRPRDISRKRKNHSDTKARTTISPDPIRQVPALSALESIEAKRLRLLQMSNWVGIGEEAHNKSAKIQFTSPKERDLIGKRRRVNRTYDTQTEHNHDKRLNHANRLEERRFEPPSQDEISVRIGSLADRSVHNDQTQKDRENREGSGTSVEASVDEMLLDHDDSAPSLKSFRSAHENVSHEPDQLCENYRDHEVLTTTGYMSSPLADDSFFEKERAGSFLAELEMYSTQSEGRPVSTDTSRAQVNPNPNPVFDNTPRHQLLLADLETYKPQSEEQSLGTDDLPAQIDTGPHLVEETPHSLQPAEVKTRDSTLGTSPSLKKQNNSQQKPPEIKHNENSNADPLTEEEQIWRDFIFSDGDWNSNKEWTLEEPQPQTDTELEPEPKSASCSSSPLNPAQTQPSMIAEISTSPIKMNPHLLIEKDEEQSSPPSTELIQLDKRSTIANATTSSDPTTDQQIRNPHHPNQTSTKYPPLPNTTAPPPSTSSSLSSPFSLSLLSELSQYASLPSPLEEHKLLKHPSSLSAQAPRSDTSHSPSSSSDEDPPHLPTTEPRVVFKKPTRYVGGRAANLAPKPVYFGGSHGRRGDEDEIEDD